MNSTIKKSKTVKEKEKLTAPKKIKILVTIIDRSKVDFYLDVLEGHEVNLQVVLYGKGTAPSDIVNYLGLVSSDKAVILSIVKEEKIKEIMIAYEDKYFKTKRGQGIGFTLPISSIIGKMVYEFLISNGGNK